VRNVDLTDRDRRLLELLGKGLSNEEIARRLGYSHGSTRVYLHKLYKKMGVEGKTAAALWFVEASASASIPVPAEDESVGDMALRTTLFTAMGAMSLLIGPYGKLWHVAARLKSAAPQLAAYENRQRCRPLWEALLKGDFSHARRAGDFRSPGEGMMLALLLRLGNASRPANKISAMLVRDKAIPAVDIELLEAVQQAIEARASAAPSHIHRIAGKLDAFTPSRHIALASLFHVYRMYGNPAKARSTAEALWAEAEASRQHLMAMGEPAMSAYSVPEISRRRLKVANPVR
jgi:DNA-binding CsgD family transcriptional regulator